MAGRVLLKIVYLLVRRILGLAVLVFRGEGAKEAELLVVWVSPCRRGASGATPGATCGGEIDRPSRRGDRRSHRLGTARRARDARLPGNGGGLVVSEAWFMAEREAQS